MKTRIQPKHALHWAAHIISVLAIIALVIVAFVTGAAVTHYLNNHGASAGRPGVSLIPGTKPVVPSIQGLGGAANISALLAGEGLGSGFCAQYGGLELGAHFKGVWACAPAIGRADDFDSVGFQCVELSDRFMWAAYHRYMTDVPSGAELVAVGHAELGIPIGYPGIHSLPRPGDVVSLSGPNADPNGHTAVVTHVGVDSQGNGSVVIMEENGSQSGVDQINVRSWSEAYGDPGYAGGLYYYPNVSWLRIVVAPKPKPELPSWYAKWEAYRVGHHLSPVTYLWHGKLSWQTSVWLKHRNLRGIVSLPRWVAPRHRNGAGYDQTRFSRGTLYQWPRYGVHRIVWR